MIQDARNISNARQAQIETIRIASRDAVRSALRRHMLLGESVAVADENNGVRLLGPEEIRRVLESDWSGTTE